MIRVIVILIVVGFAATSFAAMSDYGVHNPSVGRRADNIVKPMSCHRVIDTITVGSRPRSVAFDSLNGYVYVANCGSCNVTVINNTNKVVDTIAVGPYPDAVAFDSLNGYVYVANFGSHNVTVINDTNKIVDTILVGLYPRGVAFDSLNGYVYVANRGSGTVSVISPTYLKYPVKFSETGLPSGTVWYVMLSNGISGVSLSNTVSLYPSNGTYSYTLATTDHTYKPSKSSGSFMVNGTSLTVSVNFTEVTYSVTFIESGLPSGTTWYLNLSNGQTLSSTTNTTTLSIINGTYSYTIATSDHIYRPSANLGILTVDGKSASESVTFSSAPSTSSNTDLYIIIGAVAAVAVVGAVITIMIRKKK